VVLNTQRAQAQHTIDLNLLTTQWVIWFGIIFFALCGCGTGLSPCGYLVLRFGFLSGLCESDDANVCLIRRASGAVGGEVSRLLLLYALSHTHVDDVDQATCESKRKSVYGSLGK
jgi:hypothetical protein